MTKATHYGHCQICGRKQKIVRGKLAKHGYSVRWNMFVGTCSGSEHLPYEQSCEQIKPVVAGLNRDIAGLVERADGLRQPATEPKAYFYHYVLSNTRVKSHYAWIEVTVEEREGTLGWAIDSKWNAGKPQPWMPAYRQSAGINRHGDTVLTLATRMNARRADAFDRERHNLESFVGWLRDRLTSWKLTELEPIK